MTPYHPSIASLAGPFLRKGLFGVSGGEVSCLESSSYHSIVRKQKRFLDFARNDDTGVPLGLKLAAPYKFDAPHHNPEPINLNPSPLLSTTPVLLNLLS